VATVNLPNLNAVSNSTSCTITGLPAGLQPATLATQTFSAWVQDNGGSVAGSYIISAGSGTITLNKGTTGGNFTSSGNKGTGVGLTFTWLLA
jgi:hypothetical protein